LGKWYYGRVRVGKSIIRDNRRGTGQLEALRKNSGAKA
jgi:hypothetical protein